MHNLEGITHNELKHIREIKTRQIPDQEFSATKKNPKNVTLGLIVSRVTGVEAIGGEEEQWGKTKDEIFGVVRR